MKIGMLGIQGDIEEHEEMIKKINHTPKRIRTVDDLNDIDALIIPGGESTTMGKLMVKYGFIEALRTQSFQYWELVQVWCCYQREQERNSHFWN